MGIRVSKSLVNTACDPVLAVPSGTQIKDADLDDSNDDEGDMAFGGGEADGPSADDSPEWMHCGVDEAAATKLLAAAGNREGYFLVRRAESDCVGMPWDGHARNPADEVIWLDVVIEGAPMHHTITCKAAGQLVVDGKCLGGGEVDGLIELIEWMCDWHPTWPDALVSFVPSGRSADMGTSAEAAQAIVPRKRASLIEIGRRESAVELERMIAASINYRTSYLHGSLLQQAEMERMEGVREEDEDLP